VIDTTCLPAPDHGVDRPVPLRDHADIASHSGFAMNTPTPRPSVPQPITGADDARVRSWLRLRSELNELNARLEYLRLMLKLGVRRIDGPR
jgi:hypothetical protein